MSASDDAFLDQIRAASTPVYRETKFEIIDYYQTEYGEQHWKGHLVNALQGLESLQNAKRANLMRRFQGGREFSPKVTAKAREEYRQLGQQLPPARYEAPTNGFHVTFVGEIRISKQCYPRHFTTYVTGDDAQTFVDALSRGEDQVRALWDLIFRLYFEDDEGEDTANGPCGSPVITVEAA